jgi:adenosylhomocysteine nucleosidase
MAALWAWKEAKGKYPSLVVNLGSAGSSLFRQGSVVNCTQFIQRDMDVTAFGHTRFTTPNEDDSPVFSAGVRAEGFPQAVCGSGDSFSTDGKMHGWNVVDMEAYALAKVCVGQGVPFCCLKFISDGADGEAALTWDETIVKASHALHDALIKIVG